MATMKGAFINLGARTLGALPNVVVFQFNPDSVTHTPTIVQPPPEDDGSGTRNARQQPGPPSESYSFNLRLDATDQVAQRNPLAVASGVLPALSALELLITPTSSIANSLSALSGSNNVRVHPPDALPPVLFFWGPLRVLPVAIVSLNITESLYDSRLNPIRADVAVNLRVLTPSQISDNRLALGAYRYSSKARETMAALNLANAAQMGAGSVLSFLL